METGQVPESPRLRALQRELTAGNTASLAAFWREIDEQGTPLVESLDDELGYVLVTFLWRATEPLTNVVVVGGLAAFDPVHNQLTRLADTDLWYKTYRTRPDLRTTYWLSPNDPLTPFDAGTAWAVRAATFQADPRNPITYAWVAPPRSVVSLPAAPPQPWGTPRSEVPHGQLERHAFRSQILGNERRVWIYTPPNDRRNSGPAALLLHFDGRLYTEEIPTPTVLDNLMAAGALPPVVAVLPGTIDGPTRTRELSCSPLFTAFLVEELLPWAQARYAITTDPTRTIVAGSSLGGLAAAFAALRYPAVFGNVLAQSGSFYWKPSEDEEFEWLLRQYVVQPRAPLRFYLTAGRLEHDPRGINGPSLALSNRHFRDVLQAKGYAVTYTEFNGGHDALCWRGFLADGLLALLGTPAI